MAEVALDDKNFSGKPFSDREYIAHVVYDFAQDGGSSSDWFNLDAFQDDVVVELLYVYVETEVDSAADGATVSIGKGNGGTEFIDTSAETNFTAGALVEADTPGTRVFFDASGDESLALTFGTEDATAGKFYVAYKVTWMPQV